MNSIKQRVARLETGKAAHGVDETITINDLPDPDEPPGPRAVIGGHEARIYKTETESVAEFRARCCKMAGPGGWVVYSMLEQCPDYWNAKEARQ